MRQQRKIWNQERGGELALPSLYTLWGLGAGVGSNVQAWSSQGIATPDKQEFQNWADRERGWRGLHCKDPKKHLPGSTNLREHPEGRNSAGRHPWLFKLLP